MMNQNENEQGQGPNNQQHQGQQGGQSIQHQTPQDLKKEIEDKISKKGEFPKDFVMLAEATVFLDFVGEGRFADAEAMLAMPEYKDLLTKARIPGPDRKVCGNIGMMIFGNFNENICKFLYKHKEKFAPLY